MAAFVSESRNYCLHVERTLLELCTANSGFTLREAVEPLGPTAGRLAAGANQDFSYGMVGNLDSLTKRGLLARGREQRQILSYGDYA